MAKCVQCGRQLPAFSFKKICPWCVHHEAAQRGEDGDDAKQIVMPAPWARQSQSTVTLTQVLFGANVALFVAMVAATYVATNILSTDFSGEIEVHFGANFGPYTLSGQWWRLLTYMFLHGDFWHIAFNMWCLWDLGRLCESLYGRWTFAGIYLITGVAGGLASVAWNPQVLSVGASGAIFGLAGALVASFYLGEFSLPRAALRGTLMSLAFFIGINVLFGAGYNLFVGDTGPGIDNACHIGGLVSGLILGALIARAAPEHDRPLRRASILLLVALIVAGSAWGIERWRGSDVAFRRLAERQRNVDRMIGELRKRIQANPQDASAHNALAHEYFVDGEFDDGEAELKRVLELQPANASARMDLGAAYLTQDRVKEAKEEFTKLLAQDANNADAHVGMGMALADEQNHAAAINEFKAAMRIEPEIRGVNYRTGISQAQLKQYDDAIASYLKEREQSDSAGLEKALADAYQAKGMMQQADEARSKAAQLRSEHE